MKCIARADFLCPRAGPGRPKVHKRGLSDTLTIAELCESIPRALSVCSARSFLRSGFAACASCSILPLPFTPSLFSWRHCVGVSVLLSVTSRPSYMQRFLFLAALKYLSCYLLHRNRHSCNCVFWWLISFVVPWQRIGPTLMCRSMQVQFRRQHSTSRLPRR